MAGMMPPNTWVGVRYQAWLNDNIAVLKSDVHSGMPRSVLADRYSQRPFAIYPDREHLSRFMKMAHDAGIGVFRDMVIEPAASQGHKD